MRVGKIFFVYRCRRNVYYVVLILLIFNGGNGMDDVVVLLDGVFGFEFWNVG